METCKFPGGDNLYCDIFILEIKIPVDSSLFIKQHPQHSSGLPK